MNTWTLRAAALVPLVVAASLAQGAVYRCTQGNGAVLYSDAPCSGGTIVDIHPGAADPNAKERLARAQSELDRAAAERRAQEQFDAARREDMRRDAQFAQNVPPPPQPDTYYDTAYGFGAPYAPVDRFKDGRHHGSERKADRHEKRVPQVVRTPHPPH